MWRDRTIIVDVAGLEEEAMVADMDLRKGQNQNR
jgi:hypothetical protein